MIEPLQLFHPKQVGTFLCEFLMILDLNPSREEVITKNGAKTIQVKFSGGCVDVFSTRYMIVHAAGKSTKFVHATDAQEYLSGLHNNKLI